jgi:hypothetical protein
MNQIWKAVRHLYWALIGTRKKNLLNAEHYQDFIVYSNTKADFKSRSGFLVFQHVCMKLKYGIWMI